MEKHDFLSTNESVDIYLDYRAKKLHNALFSYEEKNPHAFKSIHITLIEIEHLIERIPSLLENPQSISLLLTLEFLYDEFLFMDDNHEVVKREIFKCMNIISSIRESLKSQAGSD